MNDSWLLMTPIIFLVALAASGGLYRIFGVLSLPSGEIPSGGRIKSYACGEDVSDSRVQPDYTQFFPFAFFFTIMHVFALIVATVPSGAPSAVAVAFAYMLASVVGLFILFRE